MALLYATDINCVLANEASTVDWSRMERTNIAGDLQQPMEFDIADDGTIFLIELAGKLKTIDSQSGKQTVVGELSVTTAQENGLIGLALAPDFSTSHWIYLQYSPPDFSGQRVSRFQFRDGQLQLDSEQRLLEYEEQRRECCHHAGSLEFGPDGCLFIGTGDNTNPFEFSEGYAPIDQRPGREPWDAQRTSANSMNFNGKVLRILPNADSGYTIPDGNLFPKDGSNGHPEIYVMGCRNPWRISVDQHVGYLYWGDVGPDAGRDGPRGSRGYDEINQARQAGFFGWPYFIGDNYPYHQYDFSTQEIGPLFDPLQPVNQSPNNGGIKQLPPAQPALIYYPAAAFDRFPEVGSGGRTACAGPVYYVADHGNSPNRLPEYFDRTLFAFEWSRNWILAVHLDEDYRVQKLEQFLPNEKFTRPIQLKFDRAGSLYVLLYGETWGLNPDSQLIRIDYRRGNRTPQAQLLIDRVAGRQPLTVNVDGQQSTDRDGDPLKYRWSYSKAASAADSSPGDAASKEIVSSKSVESKAELSTGVAQSETIFGDAAVAKWTFDAPGVYTIHLDVADPSGAVSRQSSNVIVGNEPPEIKFVSPQDGDFFNPKQPITYELEVQDHEDGTSNYAAVADSNDLVELDPSAVSRVFVEWTGVELDGKALDDQNAPAGLRLIRQSGCLNCHAINRALVGPAFVEVANKYRGQKDQLELSIQRVQKGSTGVWGKVPMLPHGHRTLDEIRLMVEYVYSIENDQNITMVNGLRNQLEIHSSLPAVRLDATYTDAGFEGLPQLTTARSIILKARKIQAEQASQFIRAQPLNSDNAEGRRFMGSINHRGFLKFAQIRLSQVGGIRASVASAGAGGRIEFRVDEPDGELLGTMEVEVNGQWEQFYQKTVRFQSDQTELADVYAVFINEKNRTGLMNVDWIEFLPLDIQPTEQ